MKRRLAAGPVEVPTNEQLRADLGAYHYMTREERLAAWEQQRLEWRRFAVRMTLLAVAFLAAGALLWWVALG